MQGPWVPLHSGKIPHAEGQLSLCPATPEPWSLEATAVRSPALQLESSPRSRQLDQALMQEPRPRAAPTSKKDGDWYPGPRADCPHSRGVLAIIRARMQMASKKGWGCQGQGEGEQEGRLSSTLVLKQ